MVKVGEVNRLADVYNWNITRIADAFNMDRGTVRRRIRDAGVLPTDRKAWYQSENERIKLEKEMRLLVPVEEVHREMSRLARSVAGGLDTLSDILERDAGLSPEVIEVVQDSTDALREQIYNLVVEDEPDSDE